jgi:hypothetical protein
MNAAAPPDAISTPVALGDEHHYTDRPPSTTIACPTKAEAPLERKPRSLLRVGINFL